MIKSLAQRPFLICFFQIIGVAAAYFIAGKLGNLLVIPPSYATLIFPSSGIALASVLLYGKRAGWGILLGAFLLNGITPITENNLSESLNPSLITLAISGGAMLQAFFGSYLVRRLAGKPHILSTKKNILLFLFYGGFVSAMVNSTFSVSLLVATGRTPAEAFFLNWLSWWGGDVLGIVIFAPLMLIWLSTKNPVWWGKRWMMTLPIFIMFLLTIATVFYEIENSNTRIKMEFDHSAKELSNVMETAIASNLNALRSLNNFYMSSEFVNENEFKIFSSYSLKNFPGMLNLEFAPIIKATERENFEHNLKQEGVPNFQITEQNTNKKLVRAGNRPEYVPIRYIEPEQLNKNSHNFDTYSTPSRRAAIDHARDTGELSITKNVSLVQETGEYSGVVAVLPVYQRDLPHNTVAERRAAVLGYNLAAFRNVEVMAFAFKNQDLVGLSYRLIDKDAVGDAQILFTSDNALSNLQALRSDSRTLVSHTPFNVGGRVWQFEIMPTTDYFTEHRSTNIWLILLTGFLLTTIIIITVLESSIRQYKIQWLVDKQHAANQELSQFKIGLDCLATGVIFVDNNRDIIYINESAIGLLRDHESNIRKDLPYFNSVDLIGKNIDLFHKNPTYQTKLLLKLKTTVETNIKLADLILNAKVSPLINEQRLRIGSIAEIIDITEKEIRALELVLANEKLAIQTAEKTAATLNLAVLNATNSEKEKRTGELVIANKHLIDANEEIAMNLQILAVLNDEKERDAVALADFHVKNDLLQNQVNYMQKLESIGRMTSGMAHEFNNILSCISGYNEMNQYVSDDMSDKSLKAELENNTQQVTFAVKRAADLINKMLMYCRQNTPKSKMNVQSPQVVIDVVLSTLCSELTSQITIETLLASDAIIQIDAMDLQQLLTNLISNARDALKERGGVITISLKKVTNVKAYCVACASVINGDFIELSVADNGTGIESKIISRLFDPFFTTKSQGEGTGLGLSAVSGIVHQSGGHLLVESNQSESNHGSTFKLLFPILG